MSGLPLSLKFGIFCDDVRREDNGKLIIIGAYASDIVFPSFPATTVLCCVLIAEASGPVDTQLDVQICYDEEVKHSGRAHLKATGQGTTFFPLRNFVFEDIQGPGTISLRLKPEGGDWQTVSALPAKARS